MAAMSGWEDHQPGRAQMFETKAFPWIVSAKSWSPPLAFGIAWSLMKIIGEMKLLSAADAPAIDLEPEATFIGSDVALGVANPCHLTR
jgi:hypothetical protein